MRTKNNEATRVCIKCKIEKSINDFRRVGITKQGFFSHLSKCKICTNEESRHHQFCLKIEAEKRSKLYGSKYQNLFKIKKIEKSVLNIDYEEEEVNYRSKEFLLKKELLVRLNFLKEKSVIQYNGMLFTLLVYHNKIIVSCSKYFNDIEIPITRKMSKTKKIEEIANVILKIK